VDLGLRNPESLGVNEADTPWRAAVARDGGSLAHACMHAARARGPAEAIEELRELLTQVASKPLTKPQSATDETSETSDETSECLRQHLGLPPSSGARPCRPAAERLARIACRGERARRRLRQARSC